jgi:hypothetical protein
MNLDGNEIVLVQGIAENGRPSGQLEATTTQDIADLGGGGGGGVAHEVNVSSGTMGTATQINTFIGFNSATAADKVADIPASTGSLGIIIISDIIGTAGTYPITVNQAIVGVNSVYTDNGSLYLLDTAVFGWVSI